LDLPSSLKIHNVFYSGNLYPYLGDKSGATIQPVQPEELKLIASELPEDRVTTEVTSDEKSLNVANVPEESVENEFDDEIGYTVVEVLSKKCTRRTCRFECRVMTNVGQEQRIWMSASDLNVQLARQGTPELLDDFNASVTDV
jgi:hypothetical protein